MELIWNHLQVVPPLTPWDLSALPFTHSHFSHPSHLLSCSNSSCLSPFLQFFPNAKTSSQLTRSVIRPKRPASLPQQFVGRGQTGLPSNVVVGGLPRQSVGRGPTNYPFYPNPIALQRLKCYNCFFKNYLRARTIWLQNYRLFWTIGAIKQKLLKRRFLRRRINSEETGQVTRIKFVAGWLVLGACFL